MWPFSANSLQKADNRVYLDYAAATPVRPEAARAMADVATLYANPSAIHRDGLAAAEALDQARKHIAKVFEVPARTLYFTSGGTEGNNVAIVGSVKASMVARASQRVHVVVAAIEHASVLEPIAQLEEQGVVVTRVAPDHEGRVSPQHVYDALTPETVLVSIGWANGEVGTVQPLHAISERIRAYEENHHVQILLHTDAGQAPLYLPGMVAGLGIDLMTLDSGKLYGPRGVGALYVRHEASVAPLFYGGGQEGGLRPGTEHVQLVVGFAAALTAATIERKDESRRLRTLREAFVKQLHAELPDAVINGSPEAGVPHIIHVSVPHIDAEYVALALDAEGISLSTKSSCEEGERVSRVVAAMVAPHDEWRAQNTLRISMGKSTSGADMSRCVAALKQVITRYRSFAKM